MVQQHCLNEETLASYLDGSLDAPMRTAAEQHLVACDACRSQMVYYMRILDEDIREDEEPVLEAAMGRWDERVTPVPPRQRPASLMRWEALAAAALVAVTLGVFTGVYLPSRNIVEIVSSRERPFKARLARQSYVDHLVTRDRSTDSGLRRYEGEVDELIRNGDFYDAGILSLYDGDFERAIGLLSMAAQQVGEAPERLNDLGVAYLERIGGTSEDRSQARQQFEAALDRNPAYPVAVYNLALYYEMETYDAPQAEQERLYRLALAQQDHYLELDPDSQWADEVREARSNLDSVFGESLPSRN